MAFNLEEEILKVTEYKSRYEARDNEYVISASMIGNEMLQNYLSIVFGKQKQKQITDPTLGTIFHKGMDTLIQPYNGNIRIQKEQSMSIKLKNDWILSGTADLIVKKDKDYEIHDYKFAKTYTMKMFKKDITNHNYTKQLIALKYLLLRILEKNSDYINSMDLYCDFFLKDASMMKGEKILHQIKIPEESIKITFARDLINQTNELQKYIEEGKTPPKCKDTWIRKIGGRTVHSRCQYYCSQAENRPYYDTMNATTMIDMANWEPNG